MLAPFFIQRFLLLHAFALAAAPALSQNSPPALAAAFDTAWRRSPQGRTLEARRHEVLAGLEAAQSWIAGSPSLGLSYRSDHWTGDESVRETDVSLSAPVWLPNQKSARQALALSSVDEVEAQIAAARLALAGEVRERLWAVAAAREALAGAQDHQQHLEGLADEVLRRVRSGDMARTDGMLAQQEVLAARNGVASAQSKLHEALARYAALAGQADSALATPETIVPAVRDPHPRLVAMRSTLRRAQVALGVVDATRSEPPTIGLLVRREQDARPGVSSRSLGISVQIPLGTSARNRPLESAALTEIETASAELSHAEALLQTDLELARQQLGTAQQLLDTAKHRAALMREHTALIAKAFHLGERGLADLLRSEALSHEAEVAVRQQQVALGLAAARLNQALGVTP